MKTIEVTLVRVYLTEEKAHLSRLLKRLNDEHRVRGMTVFRGIAGFGQTGALHSSSLLDVSLDLPVVIEFFDEAGKASEVMEELYAVVGSGHIVSWPVQLTIEQ
ncbi:MAG TPA: DUF190 domain-containing protein [Gammaproteobacteria bacterium]|nr:DUF190 domain-containing protein [Gammaproteobacteria bacterium]